MKNYIEINEDSNGAILKKAREDYAKKNNKKFSQNNLAQKLGVPASIVGLWEQGRRKIPPIHFKKINNLLGTNFKTTNETADNTDLHYTLYLYLGFFNFTQKQYYCIIGNLLIKYCKKMLDKETINKINQFFYSCDFNKTFSKSNKLQMNECYSLITKYINKHLKTYSTDSEELYKTFTTLDPSKVVDKNHLNIPVYNSSGIIEYHEEIPQKFNNDSYEYIYIKIDRLKHKFPEKYEDGALVLIRLGNFCFQDEDVLIQCGKQFDIKHIRFKTDLINAFKESFGEDAIIENGYNIIGAIVMIDYSTISIQDNDFKISF